MKPTKLSAIIILIGMVLRFQGQAYCQQVAIVKKSHERGFVVISKQSSVFIRTTDSVLRITKWNRLRVDNKSCFKYIDPINVINIIRAKSNDSLSLSKNWFKGVADKKKAIIVGKKKYTTYPINQEMVLVSIAYPQKKELLYFTFPFIQE